jgi:hypothetical protein
MDWNLCPGSRQVFIDFNAAVAPGQCHPSWQMSNWRSLIPRDGSMRVLESSGDGNNSRDAIRNVSAAERVTEPETPRSACFTDFAAVDQSRNLDQLAAVGPHDEE